MEQNLTTGSVFRNVVRFSLPYLLVYFLQTLYGMASNTLFFQASQPPKCQSDLQLLIRIKATGEVPPRLSPASPACGSPSAPSAPPCDSR